MSDKINIPNDLTKTEIADLIGKLSDQMKIAPEKNDEVYIWAIIDRSGSMGHIVNDSIGGFNTFLKDQVEDKNGTAYLSIALFDNEYIELETIKDVKYVKPLTKETYVPRGSTALYDAIGKTLSKAKALNKKNNIVVILTDGEENSSVEFNLDKVKELTTEAESKGWKFVYLAANQDAFAKSRMLGLVAAATSNFVADSLGTTRAYADMSSHTKSYRADFSK